MMRVLGAIVWVCLILTVLAELAQSAEENEAVPVIELEMATYDFGQVSQGEVVRQDFRVLNRGSVPLEINSVRPGCGCSTARFDRTIPPGGDGKIVLEVRTNGYQGDIYKTARVFTNDPKHPQVIIGMKGRVWVPIHINPRYVHLKGMLGDEIEGSVHLRAEKKEPLVIKVASVSIPDKVAVELQEIERGRGYELRVKNKVKKETTYQGHVRLTTNYLEKPEAVIRISGCIRGAP